MKRIASLLLTLLLALSCAACKQTREPDPVMYPDRTLHQMVNTENSFIGYAFDFMSMRGATEFADLVIVGTVLKKAESPRRVPFAPSGSLSFAYTVQIDQIWYDREQVCEVGQTILIDSCIGMMRADSYYALYPSDKPNVTDPTENDYCSFHGCGALPIDADHTFLLFLDSEGLAATGTYRDATLAQVYGIKNGTVYFGSKGEMWGTIEALRTEFDTVLAERTGERDDFHFPVR